MAKKRLSKRPGRAKGQCSSKVLFLDCPRPGIPYRTPPVVGLRTIMARVRTQAGVPELGVVGQLELAERCVICLRAGPDGTVTNTHHAPCTSLGAL